MFLKLTLKENNDTSQGLNRSSRLALGTLLMALCALLASVVINSPKAAPDLAIFVHDKLHVSGVENPVTAVLLNFRSYDTLLEIAVLLIVATALMPVCTSGKDINKPFITTEKQTAINPLLLGLIRWLVPLALVIGGYLLWTGAYAPGGAFQAAAVIAGAGIVLVLAERHVFHWHSTGVRIALVIGLLFFVLAAILSSGLTGTTLAFPSRYASAIILTIEIAATISIALVLLMSFSQLRSLAQPDEKSDQEEKTP